MLGKEQAIEGFSIFGGLAINTSPLPLFFFDNKQLEVIKGGQLLAKSQLRYIDAIGKKVEIDKSNELLNIPNVYEIYVIRIGAGQFIVVFWDDDIDQREIYIYEQLIQKLYPYTLISNVESEVIVGRCTHAFNYSFIHIIDTNLGLSIADSVIGSLEATAINRKELGEEEWNKFVKELRKKNKSPKG